MHRRVSFRCVGGTSGETLTRARTWLGAHRAAGEPPLRPPHRRPSSKDRFMPPDGRPRAHLYNTPPARAWQPRRLFHALDGRHDRHARCSGGQVGRHRLMHAACHSRRKKRSADDRGTTTGGKRSATPRHATLSVTGVVCAHRRSRDEAGLRDGRWGRAHWAC